MLHSLGQEEEDAPAARLGSPIAGTALRANRPGILYLQGMEKGGETHPVPAPI